MSDIEWHDASENPPIEFGCEGYFMVVTERSKRAFGAHYLNKYKLIPRDDDCPSASVENDFTPCQGCSNGDGHEFTGWYHEEEDSDGEVFMPFDAFGPHAVLKWASMPDNPFYAPPEKTP